MNDNNNNNNDEPLDVETLINNIKLHNVVATISLNINLDLKKIALGARNTEYNPKRFSAVIMKIRDPRTTALMFSSGKIIVTGANSPEASQIASKKFLRILQKMGFSLSQDISSKINNMIATVDLQFPVSLETLSSAIPKLTQYEPELFPGLIYKLSQPKCVFLIFVSGKIVFTGCISMEVIRNSLRRIYDDLVAHRKTKVFLSKNRSLLNRTSISSNNNNNSNKRKRNNNNNNNEDEENLILLSNVRNIKRRK